MSDLVHVRALPADDLRLRDGVLEGRLVPFGVATRVADPTPDGGLDIYEEGFRPGVFDRQLSAVEPGVIRRIELVHTHEGGLGFLGPAQWVEQKADGIFGAFRVIRSRRDDVEDLLSEGVDELSIEFRERIGGTSIDDNGVRWRTSAHLDRVALEAQGAYTGAKVLAYRSELDQLAAERAAAEAEEQRKADEAAAAEAAAAARAEEAAAHERKRRELDDWLEAEQAKQAELVAKFR